MLDPVDAWNKISSFNDPQEIRELFQRDGIKAYRSRHDSCALAQWLTNVTGEKSSVIGNVLVGFKTVEKEFFLPVGWGRGPNTYSVEEALYQFDHTDATLQFIDMFDNGEYPELEAPTLPEDEFGVDSNN